MNKKEINFPFGIFARKAVTLSLKIKEGIYNPFFIEKDNRRANAKSLLGLLSLGVKEGEKVVLIGLCDEDIEKAEKIIKIIQEEF